MIINTIVVMDLWNLQSEFRVGYERRVGSWGLSAVGPSTLGCPHSTVVASII